MRNKKGQFVKGLIPWNKGKKGYMGANRTSFKKGENVVPLPIRFWDKVGITSNCWYWIGAVNNKGYGRINIGGKSKLAHRISYEMANGKIDDSIKVLHSCDNTFCVNPKHLWLGTQKDNAQDMSKKGRWGNQFYKNLC